MPSSTSGPIAPGSRESWTRRISAGERTDACIGRSAHRGRSGCRSSGLDSTVVASRSIPTRSTRSWNRRSPRSHPSRNSGFPGLLHRERAPESLLLTLYQRSVAVSSQLLWNADRTGAVDEADPILRLGLLEPLGAPFSETRASLQADRLAVAGEASDVRVPDFLPRAVDPGGVADLLEACAEEPALRPIANRAVRALADAAAGRWDAWLAGVGAAHATEAVAEGSTPVLGAYGWVDAPYPDAAYRGKPGPGPGDSVLPPRRRSPAPSRCCETGPSSTPGAGPCSTIRRSSAKRGGGWRTLRSGGTPPAARARHRAAHRGGPHADRRHRRVRSSRTCANSSPSVPARAVSAARTVWTHWTAQSPRRWRRSWNPSAACWMPRRISRSEKVFTAS